MEVLPGGAGQTDERLVIMAEVSYRDAAQREATIRAISRTLAEAMLPAADAIELVPRGAVPRTTSGKIRHSGALERYLSTHR